MVNDAFYAFCLDDPAVPAFCSFSKLYFGTEADLLEVAGNLEKYGNYPETAAGIRSFFAGNTGVTHVIAYKEIPVLQPVEMLDSSEMMIGPYQWTHMNTWDCPYDLRFDSAIISQLLLRYDGKVLRCIRARFNGLAYLAYADRWNPIGGTIFGHPSVLSIRPKPEGGYDFGTILYMCEDSATSPLELWHKMHDPDALNFNPIIDEVLGDG